MFLVSGAVIKKFGKLSEEKWKDIHQSCNRKCIDANKKVQLNVLKAWLWSKFGCRMNHLMINGYVLK